MQRLALVLMFLSCVSIALAQSGPPAARAEALRGLAAQDAEKRALSVAWIAEHGTPADSGVLRRRLTDEDPTVRSLAEQALWQVWGRSGDKAVDALMAEGDEAMQNQRFDAAIATFSEVIKRKPSFAEGWNRRATVLFLAGQYRKSLADCNEVMKRNPDHFGALAGYGHIYFRLEQYEKAIEFWKRALRVNPNMDGIEISIRATEQLLAERRKRSA